MIFHLSYLQSAGKNSVSTFINVPNSLFQITLHLTRILASFFYHAMQNNCMTVKKCRTQENWNCALRKQRKFITGTERIQCPYSG